LSLWQNRSRSLINDYEKVVEGLHALLRPSEREIHVVEMDVRNGPRRRVEVTLLDPYGEVENLGIGCMPLQSTRDLCADLKANLNGTFNPCRH
jgi:hypothetical protein